MKASVAVTKEFPHYYSTRETSPQTTWLLTNGVKQAATFKTITLVSFFTFAGLHIFQLEDLPQINRFRHNFD